MTAWPDGESNVPWALWTSVFCRAGAMVGMTLRKRSSVRGGFVPDGVGCRLILSVLLIGILSGCATRHTAQRAAPHHDARTETIHVAMQRQLNFTGPMFGAERPQHLRYFRADISVPPTHQPGRIEWPEGEPDAATDFVVTRTETMSGIGEMLRSLDASSPGPGRETVVYVHGYNNTLSESMYRLAQIQTDFRPNRAAVLFSWPSAGDPRGYIYDRDSVLYSRDDLLSVLQALTASPGRKVFLIAHSMGAQLVMEVLRQAALSGDRTLLSRVSGVILMSPDIEPDVFQRQAEAVGELPQPFLIFTSRQDRILSLSGLLTGRKPRLGVIDGPDKVEGLPVQVVDFTALSDGAGFGHSVPATTPAAVRVLRGMIQQAERGNSAFEKYLLLDALPGNIRD